MVTTKLPKLASSVGLLSVISVLWCLCSGGVYAATVPATASEPPRIIAAGGSVTEIIYALGRGDWVVATDSTSMFPAAAKEVTKLGYFRQLSTEGVLAQQPTLLLGASATGPAPMLQQVKNAGVSVHVYEVSKDINGLGEMVLDIGKKVSAQKQAEQLMREVRHQVMAQQAKYAQVSAQLGSAINALFVVANNDRGITVAGNNTVPQALFDTLGISNIAADLDGYKLMDAESVLMRNPDVVFVAGHMLHGENALNSLCSHHAIAATFAGKHCLIKAMESSIGLGLSPRFGIALEAVTEHALLAIALKHESNAKISTRALVQHQELGMGQ